MTLDALGPLSPLAADLVLFSGAFSILLADTFMPAGEKKSLIWAGLGTLVASLVATVTFDISGAALGGVYIGDGLALVFKQLVMGAGALVLLGAHAQIATDFARRQGEYVLLLLLSVLGMSLLAGATDILLLAVCFELMGLPLYVLAAFNKTNKRAVEGGFKLYLISAVSSITLLYGLSLLFGLSGSTSISAIQSALVAQPSVGAIVALTLVFCGMGFKIGLFPFHMWVPDTYEGSSTPIAAFLSVGPKIAGVAVFVQLFLSGAHPFIGPVTVIATALTGATLVFGNLLALNQDNVKRLLAFSGVGHMAFILLALITQESSGLTALLFYLVTYLFTNLGLFLVLHVLEQSDHSTDLSVFNGLAQRDGFLSLAVLVFVLSLAGVPFVAGFWAKLYVFIAAWAAGYFTLVLLGGLISVLALFYYLRLVRAVFMRPAQVNGAVTYDLGSKLVIGLCLVAVIGLGLRPNALYQPMSQVADTFLQRR